MARTSKIDAFAHLLGELTDEQIAEMADVKPATVTAYRRRLEQAEAEPEAVEETPEPEQAAEPAQAEAKAEPEPELKQAEPEPESEPELEDTEPEQAEAEPEAVEETPEPLRIRVHRTVRVKNTFIVRSIYEGEVAQLYAELLDEDAYEVIGGTPR